MWGMSVTTERVRDQPARRPLARNHPQRQSPKRRGTPLLPARRGFLLVCRVAVAWPGALRIPHTTICGTTVPEASGSRDKSSASGLLPGPKPERSRSRGGLFTDRAIAKEGRFDGATATATATTAGPPPRGEADGARIAEAATSITGHLNPKEAANELADRLWSMNDAEKGELFRKMIDKNPGRTLELLYATTTPGGGPGGISAENREQIQDAFRAAYEQGALGSKELQGLTQQASRASAQAPDWVRDIVGKGGETPKLKDDWALALASGGYGDAALKEVATDPAAKERLLQNLDKSDALGQFLRTTSQEGIAKFAGDLLGQPPASAAKDALFDKAVSVARDNPGLQRALGKYLPGQHLGAHYAPGGHVRRHPRASDHDGGPHGECRLRKEVPRAGRRSEGFRRRGTATNSRAPGGGERGL